MTEAKIWITFLLYVFIFASISVFLYAGFSVIKSDLQKRIIEHIDVLIIALSGVLYSAISFLFYSLSIQTPFVTNISIVEKCMSAFISFFTLSLFEFIWRRLRGIQGFGFGDIKLISALSFWVGKNVFFVLLFASFFSVIVSLIKNKLCNKTFAFGPYLIMCSIIILPYTFG